MSAVLFLHFQSIELITPPLMNRSCILFICGGCNLNTNNLTTSLLSRPDTNWWMTRHMSVANWITIALHCSLINRIANCYCKGRSVEKMASSNISTKDILTRYRILNGSCTRLLAGCISYPFFLVHCHLDLGVRVGLDCSTDQLMYIFSQISL